VLTVTLRHTELPGGRSQSYSQAVSDGHLIYTSGQLGAVPGGDPVGFGEQVEAALTRLIEVLEAAGGGVETILRVNAYVADIDDFDVYDEIYRRLLTASPKPTRPSVQVGGFVPPVQIEVDAVATVRGAAGA
jgi:2-iminobutanoate/2-iminopropanoate deaminase